MEHNCKLCDKTCGSRRKMCNTCLSRIRRYNTKEAAVKILGGKCNRCGWTGDSAAFEFHHPKGTKEFTLGKHMNLSWGRLVKEILKCELLCSNCHRSEHHGV